MRRFENLRMNNGIPTEKRAKYSLAELKGVLATDNNTSYSDMLEEYFTHSPIRV